MPRLPLTTFPLDEIVVLARRAAPFYRRLYESLPERPALADLPLLDGKAFWEAHAREPREVLTGELVGGIGLNSGGSTGAPKFTYLSDEEIDSAIALTAASLDGTGLQAGDRVANFFGAGYLYASLIVATWALKETATPVWQLPVAHLTPVPDAVRLMLPFRTNVWAGVTTHLINLAVHVQKEKIEGLPLRLILYAGEPCTPDQRKFLEGVFPGVAIRSISYASVDGGVIGVTTPDCGPGEHRVPDGAVLLEILDEETGEVIEDVARPGKIVFTNLTRRLMPTLRYPTGDRARWVEPGGSERRKFLLLGRAEESARLSNFNVPVEEVARLLEPFRTALEIQQFQLVVTQEELRDCLTIRLATGAPRAMRDSMEPEILEALGRQKPLLAEMIAKGIIRPVRLEWVEPGQVEINPRTGKARGVIDRRLD